MTDTTNNTQNLKTPELTGHDARLIQRALNELPATCRYHGENFEQDYGIHGTGSCCDTGKPSLYRHHAQAALKRATGGGS